MTSSLRPEPCDHRQRQTRPARGFTLIEMLVVIGIILVLLAILLPSAGKAYKESVRNNMAADLNAISQALDVYKDTFGDYPRPGKLPSGTVVNGPEVLCWALLAPGPAATDGADGPGFRIRGTQGQVYGPYLSPDRFKLSGSVDGTDKILDRYGQPILYFVSSPSSPPTSSYVKAYTVGQTPPQATYNFSDDSQYLPFKLGTCNLTLKVMRYRLGDTNNDGKISGTETALTTAPYLLWSAGPDGIFGPQVAPNSSGTLVANGADDDVTNVPLNFCPPGFAP